MVAQKFCQAIKSVKNCIKFTNHIWTFKSSSKLNGQYIFNKGVKKKHCIYSCSMETGNQMWDLNRLSLYPNPYFGYLMQ